MPRIFKFSFSSIQSSHLYKILYIMLLVCGYRGKWAWARLRKEISRQMDKREATTIFSGINLTNNRRNAQTTKQFAMDLAQVSIVSRKLHSIGIRSFQKMPLSLKETFLVLHETVGRRRNIKVQEFAAAGGTATHTEPRRALLPTCRGGCRN